jgi:hypothetical protein
MDLPEVIREASLRSLERVNVERVENVNVERVEASLRSLERFVICISRDFDDQINLLKNYGKVVIYDHTLYANLNPLSFDWDYLILDHREKNDRYYHLRFIKPIENIVKVLLFCHAIENQDLKNENHYDNVLNKLPERQARKKDFDQLLLIERLTAPKWWWSLVKCLFKNYASAS